MTSQKFGLTASTCSSGFVQFLVQAARRGSFCTGVFAGVIVAVDSLCGWIRWPIGQPRDLIGLEDAMPQPIQDSDRAEIRAFIEQQWYAPHVCIKGKLYYPHESEGFILRRGGKLVGLLTFQSQGDSMLVITQNSTEAGTGIGSSLLLRVIEEARKRRARRVWLTTTNDNLKSIGFYQRMGFRLVAIYRDAVAETRKDLKPEMPEFGMNGLPILDEIEMELILEPSLTK